MKKIFIAALLVLLAVACVAFIACNSGDSNGNTTGEPSENTPTTEDPGTDAPGTDAPGTDAPGTDAPGTDDPGTDAPGTDAPEVPVEPDPIKITIDGVSITQYKIVYPSDAAESAAYSAAEAEVKAAEAAVNAAADDAAKKAAEAELNAAKAKLEAARTAWAVKIYAKETADFLAAEILKASEEVVSVVCETEAASEYEIVVGVTGRGEAPACPEYYSYKVIVNGKKMFLNGYDNYAVDNAAYAIVNKMKTNEGANAISEFNLEYTLPAYTEYLENPELLYMRWIKEWQPDPRMLDYSLKIDAFINVSDRLMTCAHRADGYYYPENSLEAIISFYLMGGDVVEIDLQATKDGVLILMHDNNLWRMTNANEFVNKTIDGMTFPNSYNVNDWTYEQIQYLNLREAKSTESNNGAWTAVTPFKVPTLVEALKFCKGRLLIIPDKTDKWLYAEADTRGSDKYYLYDAMVEADNYESILISYGLTVEQGVAIQKYIYEKSGVVPFLLIRDNSAAYTVYKMLKVKAMPNSYGVQAGGAFDPVKSPQTFAGQYEKLNGTVMVWGWTIDDTYDKEVYWKQMYGHCYRMIMTNHYLQLVMHAATTFSFD